MNPNEQAPQVPQSPAQSPAPDATAMAGMANVPNGSAGGPESGASSASPVEAQSQQPQSSPSPKYDENSAGNINGTIIVDSEAMPEILLYRGNTERDVLAKVKMIRKFDDDEDGFARAEFQILDISENM